ncbi:MAG: TIGR00730 family Rossman fold protein [Patescibacteria group bacterium]
MKSQGTKPLTLHEISEAAEKRVALIAKEFTDGFEFIKNYSKSVTFFGSARIEENSPYYQKARALASRITRELHYAVVTGGGPGIMEAANRGAYEAGGNSIGLTIELPEEQVNNPYLTDFLGFHYFFSRKVCLSFSAEAYLFFPGGYGTLDEFLEILTLVQTMKIPKAPIVLVGSEYWNDFHTLINKKLLESGYIDIEDTSIYKITDDDDEILEIIKKAPIRMGVAYNDHASDNHANGNHSGPISELGEKHCVPCEGDTPPLSREESEEYLKNVNNWTLIENKEIEKTYTFKNFTEAFDFISNVAKIAEKEGHHPDIRLHDYKQVTIKISTHAISGLSENDFILAAKIDKIAVN